MSKAQELTINIGLFALSNFATKLLIFVCLPIYTAYLSSESYAMLDLSQTTTMLFLPILTISISDAVVRFSMKPGLDADETLSVGIRIVSISILVMLVASPIVYLCFRSLCLTMAFLVYYALNALCTLLSSFCRAIDKVPTIASASIVSAIVTFCFVLITIIVLDMEFLGFFIASDLGLLACLVLYCLPLKKNLSRAIRIRPDVALRKQMIAFSLPLIPNAVFWLLSANSGKFILAFVSGLTVAGYFSAVSRLPAILSTLVSIFQQAWNLSVFKEHDAGQAQGIFIFRVFAVFRMGNVVIAAILIVCMPWLAELFLQGDFFDAWQLAPLLICASYFSSMSAYYGSFFSASMRTRPLFASTLIGALLNIVLSFALAFPLGALGITIAMCISNYSIYLLRRIYLAKHNIFAFSLKLQETLGFCLAALAVVEMNLAGSPTTYFFAIVIVVSTIVLGILDSKAAIAYPSDSSAK